MDKDQILGNVDSLTAENLFGFISEGKVTLDELRKTDNLDPIKLQAILKLQKNECDQKDDDAWKLARYADEAALNDYISKYPAGRHVQEAKDNIESLKQTGNKQKILDKIKRNPNSYSPDQIQSFLKNKTITESELKDCNIPQSAIDNLSKVKSPTLNLGKTPDSIPDGYTEVYFWGGTGSGKTCALGAVLHMAEKKRYLNIAEGRGNLYAIQLKNIFNADGNANDFLPAPSPVDTTQYLPFTLKYPEEKVSRSVSLIELSGEIFKCFLYQNSEQPFPTESHEKTFNSLNTFLESNNYKIHFFFIDYDRENSPDAQGIKPSDYLAAAATYFKNNAVFEKNTVAIYVILTKSDLLIDENDKPVTGYDKRVKYSKKYLENQNYESFINALKDNCKKYSINNGKLTIEPFSLGKVYFKVICDFDGSAAEKIIEILMKRIVGTKKNILDD
ncbi:MAG: hypothetical protein LBQ73_02945 [Tannerellaceae bacterium]|jgi:hypothetical protein|nr:hypothetical protein [Tannerellaceae bacterium]